MKRFAYLLAFVLAVTTAYAVSQNTTAQPQNPDQHVPTGSTTSVQDDAQQTPSASPPQDQANDNQQNQNQRVDADQTAAVDNETLHKQVHQQLASDPAFRNVQVMVEEDAVVRLEGSVPDKDARKRAKQLAKSVPGVRKVKAKLEVDANLAAGATTDTNAAAATTARADTDVTGDTSATDAAATGTAATDSSMSGQTTTGTTTATGTTADTSMTGQTTATGTTGTTGTAETTTTGTTGDTSMTGQTTTTTGTTGTTGTAETTTTGTTGDTSMTGQATTTTGTTGTTDTTQATGAMTTSTEGATLRSRIETEFQKQNLSGVIINVTDDTIELTGTVPTGKEKQTAKRVASSFAGNRRVVDRLTVTGRGVENRSPNSPNATDTDPSRADEDREQTDPNQQNMPENDPDQKGDASSQPR